ncbi:MAG: transglutaminase-like domain-containing protein [Pirellulaceae bacterium]|nr:transglutaminase-like domain-containing protein [Pirellulaceae bacterium]
MRVSQPSENRRRIGAIVLAIIAIAALVRLRLTCEVHSVLAIDVGLNALLVVSTAWAVSRAARHSHVNADESVTVRRDPRTLMFIGAALAVLFPLIANTIEQSIGEGTGSEIAYLGMLAWGALVAAIFAKLNRTLSISVVCSGFLTLFTTVSSDHRSAVYFAFCWGVMCLWWLITNHWEKVEACQIDSLKSNKARTPFAIGAGSLIFAVAAWSASGGSVISDRMKVELMNTSGGTSRYHAGARSGVGDGDAVVAARDHAASFGAVETDVFLDSPAPSLFDIFNDTFGEPSRKKKSERAIALAPREDQSTSSRTSKSNSTTQSFTTQRSDPKPRKPLMDLKSDAAMFWIGRTGERLATHRYTRFDGVDWHHEDSSIETKIVEYKIGERVWFKARSDTRTIGSPYIESNAEALKFTKFRSNRIPAPAGVEMWHIDMVDQSSFFGFSSDGCLEMPGRDFVPDYTTVRFVNRSIDLEKLEALTRKSPEVPLGERPSASDLSSDAAAVLAKQMANEWVPNAAHDWATIQLVVDRLRREFTFDCEGASQESTKAPLEDFLINRRGNDYLFATAASVMLREFGFRTRFVTGFYVDPKKYDRIAGQTPITPQDAHAWLEVDVGMDTWIPLEPTPGFLPPTYRVSLAYRLRQNAAAIVGGILGSVVLVAIVWLSRAYLFEGVCWMLRYLLPLLNDRRRVRWLVGVLDRRLQLAGMARPRSITPREWLMRNLVLQDAKWSKALVCFFNEADRLNFGNGEAMSTQGRQACVELWRETSTFVFRRTKAAQWNRGLECSSRI